MYHSKLCPLEQLPLLVLIGPHKWVITSSVVYPDGVFHRLLSRRKIPEKISSHSFASSLAVIILALRCPSVNMWYINLGQDKPCQHRLFPTRAQSCEQDISCQGPIKCHRVLISGGAWTCPPVTVTTEYPEYREPFILMSSVRPDWPCCPLWHADSNITLTSTILNCKSKQSDKIWMDRTTIEGLKWGLGGH